MKAQTPSWTARLIAAAVISGANRRDLHPLLGDRAASLSRLLLSTSRVDRMLAWSVSRGAGLVAWKLVELFTHPGIVRHWLTRKAIIEKWVRDEIDRGTRRVVIIGAGLDTLGIRLDSEERSTAIDVVEIDHPATQGAKRRALRNETCGVEFVPVDLQAIGIDEFERLAHGTDRRPTAFVIEGVLMYVEAERVREILAVLGRACTGSKVILTAMESRDGEPTGFRPRSLLVEAWLRVVGEPFAWSLKERDVKQFAGEIGLVVEESASCTTDQRLADGEWIARVRSGMG
jgi:methyltransferase (TIGR00027 family)